MGYAYILALSFVVTDPGNDAAGFAVAQLFFGIFKDRYGSGTGGLVCLGGIAVALYFGGLGCVLSNSRLTTIAPHYFPKNLLNSSLPKCKMRVDGTAA